MLSLLNFPHSKPRTYVSTIDILAALIKLTFSYVLILAAGFLLGMEKIKKDWPQVVILIIILSCHSATNHNPFGDKYSSKAQNTKLLPRRARVSLSHFPFKEARHFPHTLKWKLPAKWSTGRPSKHGSFFLVRWVRPECRGYHLHAGRHFPERWVSFH